MYVRGEVCKRGKCVQEGEAREWREVHIRGKARTRGKVTE